MTNNPYNEVNRAKKGEVNRKVSEATRALVKLEKKYFRRIIHKMTEENFD